jgi:multiple sugar transport system permease protein
MTALTPELGGSMVAGGADAFAFARPSGQRLDGAKFQWGSLVLLAPAVVLLAGLLVFPVAYAFYLGFTNLSLVGPTAVHFQFTGLANFSRLIHDSVFYTSLSTTGYFVVGSIFGVVFVGMLMALALQSSSRSVRTIVGSVAVIAWMMPALSAGVTWYATTVAGGEVATTLGQPTADYLASAPLLVVTLANVWSMAGFVMLIFSAALRNVPTEVVEAAKIENAGPLRIFARITLPVIRPTVITTVLFIVLLSIGNFSLVYIMTQGGPFNATNILPVYSYQQAFTFQNLAYGALVGDVLVVIATILAFWYVRVSRVRPARTGGR